MFARTGLQLHRYSRICDSIASISSTSVRFSTEKRSVDDVTRDLLNQPPTKVPVKLSRMVGALKTRFRKENIDPHLKVMLDKASAQLYFDCANNFNYEKLLEMFGLPDYMSSWYKLTLMHTWMILMRLHVSLDAEAYLRLQRGLLAALWLDVDQRLEIVGKELNQVMSAKTDMQHMHGLHLQTFLEYDEGFLHDDRVLAGAIWRCLYMEREFDPVNVIKVISYMRSTIGWLDTLDLNDVLVDGIKEWKQIRPTVTSKSS